MTNNVIKMNAAPRVSVAEKVRAYSYYRAQGFSQVDSHEKAGYARSAHEASRFAKTYAKEIASHMADHIGDHAPQAFQVIIELMNNVNEKGSIRLKAAQDVLDRAGLGANKKVELTTKDASDMTSEEIRQSITSMLEELSINPPGEHL